jgi:CheY-like chemotaxis protein
MKLDGTAIELPPYRAEEFFGLRHAREALDLDPAYLPAQQVLLSLLLERTFADALDQYLLKPMPAGVRNLLASIDSDLVMSVLERALDEQKPAVILPALTALGERGEVRAARLNSGGQPRGIVRALYYPDRRVQLTAARALLKMPGSQAPVAALRVVDVLRRFLASDGTPRILAASVPPEKTATLRQALKTAGYDVVEAGKLPDAFEKLRGSADFDAILLHEGLPAAELPFALSQLRADADQGLLPVFIVPRREAVDSTRKLARGYRNVLVLPEVMLTMPDELKNTLDSAIKASQGAKLSPEERKELTKIALDVLWRMARGELSGFDVRPAQEALWSALRSEDLAVQALEVIGRLPGHDVQRRLATVATDAGRGKLRVPAAIELNRHIQKYGMLLEKRQIDDVKTAYSAAGDDANLKTQLALVLGSLRPSPQATGAQLSQFRSEPPAAAAEKKEKE